MSATAVSLKIVHVKTNTHTFQCTIQEYAPHPLLTGSWKGLVGASAKIVIELQAEMIKHSDYLHVI